jgi:hypothetical protein
VIGAAIESLFKPDTLRRGRVNQGFDHPFTMTLNPAPGSTKKYTSQVPLYL